MTRMTGPYCAVMWKAINKYTHTDTEIRGYIDDRKEAGGEAQCAKGLSKRCRESVSPLSRLNRGIRNNWHWFIGMTNANSIKRLL